MKIGARFLALQDILDLFLQNPKPLDHLINIYFLNRRYAGSKDRKYIKDHLFCLFRHWGEVAWETSQQPRELLISYLVRIHHWTEDNFQQIDSESPHSFAPLSFAEQSNLLSLQKSLRNMPDYILGNVPEFLWPEFERTFQAQAMPQAISLKQEASTDLRVNTLKTNRLTVLKKLEDSLIKASSTPYAITGIRLKNRFHLGDTKLFLQGMVEIQDEGSQLLTEFCSVSPQDQILDFCAGSGGKSLALGAIMQNKGRIVATDYDKTRLERMIPRLKKSGLHNIILKDFSSLEESFNSFDLVLVDSPCSGSGTWRRAPDLRLRLTKKDLQNYLDIQQSILTQAAGYVRSAGRLIYVTCSLLHCENQDQIHKFLNTHSNYRLNRVFQVSPLTHGTDGFYGAELYKA